MYYKTRQMDLLSPPAWAKGISKLVISSLINSYFYVLYFTQYVRIAQSNIIIKNIFRK